MTTGRHDPGRSFAETIQSKSLQRAESEAIRLRGTLYEEPAAEWQNALRGLENAFLDKQGVGKNGRREKVRGPGDVRDR